MIRNLIILMSLFFILPGPLSAKDTPESLSGVKVITVDEVKVWLDDGKDMFILDARTEEQYEESHLPDATRCPVNTELGLSDPVIDKAVSYLKKCDGLSDFPKFGVIITYCNAYT